MPMILEIKTTQLINATHNILLHIVIVVRQRDGVGAMGAVSPLSLNKVFILKKISQICVRQVQSQSTMLSKFVYGERG